MRTYLGTITREMVGKSWSSMGGRIIMWADSIGNVQLVDVGKRVFDVDGVIQVENNEQRDRRVIDHHNGRSSP